MLMWSRNEKKKRERGSAPADAETTCEHDSQMSASEGLWLAGLIEILERKKQKGNTMCLKLYADFVVRF